MYYQYEIPVDSGIRTVWTQWAGVFLSCDVDSKKDYFRKDSVLFISEYLLNH